MKLNDAYFYLLENVTKHAAKSLLQCSRKLHSELKSLGQVWRLETEVPDSKSQQSQTESQVA
jgi:hypothetical protein